MAEAAYVIAV